MNSKIFIFIAEVARLHNINEYNDFSSVISIEPE